MISWGPHSSLERERKIRRRLFTTSIKRKITHFHVVVVPWRQRNVQKEWCTCKVVFCLLCKPIAFLTLSLLSPSSLLNCPRRADKVFTLHQSMAQNLSAMWHSTFDLDVARSRRWDSREQVKSYAASAKRNTFFPSSIFRRRPNFLPAPHHQNAWNRLISAGRSFAPSQKSRCHNRSWVWT